MAEKAKFTFNNNNQCIRKGCTRARGHSIFLNSPLELKLFDNLEPGEGMHLECYIDTTIVKLFDTWADSMNESVARYGLKLPSGTVSDEGKKSEGNP